METETEKKTDCKLLKSRHAYRQRAIYATRKHSVLKRTCLLTMAEIVLIFCYKVVFEMITLKLPT